MAGKLSPRHRANRSLYTGAREAAKAELRRRQELAMLDGDVELREAVGKALEHRACIEAGTGLADQLRKLARVWAMPS